jgi:hypothetical protein
MTRTRIAVIGVAILCAVAILGMAVFMIAQNTLHADTPQAVTACSTTGTTYTVYITNAQLSINDIHAKRCDTLTITNNDATLRIMAFGVHDKHLTYDGVTEKTLAQGQSLSVTLNQTGTFTFHDHLNDAVKGTFVVE